MITVPLISELKIQVPEHIVHNLMSIYNQLIIMDAPYQSNVNLTKMFHLQWVDDKFASKYNHTNPNDLNVVEQYALATKWLYDFPEIQILKDWISQYFNTQFAFRLHNMRKGKGVDDPAGHSWPRIFIPIINDNVEYTIVDNNGIKHSMVYKVGKCYIWDTRLPHFVRNLDEENDRLVGVFMIKPDVETKLLEYL